MSTNSNVAAAAANPTPAPTTVLYKIQDHTRFSASHLWRLMSEYYASNGVSAWTSYSVPFFITCNNYIGHKYALMIQEYMKNRDGPVWVVELGAGSGKLGFHILRALDDLNALTNVNYVMTDFAEKNIEFWMKHTAFSTFIERGVLDFAKFDIYNDSEFKTTKGTIPSDANVIFVANYIFDTLSADAFKIEGGKLKEARVSLCSRQDETNALDPAILQRMVVDWSFEDIDPETYYDKQKEPALHSVLNWYYDHFKDSPIEANVIIPTTILNFLNRMVFKDIFVIAGDKSHTDAESCQFVGAPHIAVHHSFSIMVNMHAIGIYASMRNGVAFHNPQADAGIKVSLFSLTSNELKPPPADLSTRFKKTTDELDLVNVKKCYEREICDFGPTDFHVIHKGIITNKEITPDAALALIKLSHWDTDTFFNVKEVIIDKILEMSRNLRQDVYYTLSKLWNYYYALNRDRDLAFDYGRLFFKTREYAKALDFYKYSNKTLGDHNVTLFNMALCHKELGDKKMAIDLLERSVKMDPSYERAKIWLVQLNSEKQVEDQLSGITL